MQRIIQLHRSSALAQNENPYQALEDMMIQAVLGSNYIERAGTTYNITLQSCRSVFRGLKVEASTGEQDPQYLEGLMALEELVTVSITFNYTWKSVTRTGTCSPGEA
jgi:hypothetical protein